jgi:hypothetical protein
MDETSEIVLETHVDREDQATNPYPMLPFEVPPGVGRLHISYQVSDGLTGDKAGVEEGNIVDIGLFDPGGADFPARWGFRGWSGTSRKEFSIAPEEATPGYLPGPIPPGTWHIQLGLYQITPAGCDVRVVIRLEPGAGAGRLRVPCLFGPSALTGGPGWFRGDLHSHSFHSDGSAPISDLAAAAEAQGLDFLAVTEHNTVSHLPEVCHPTEREVLLIPGLEITTYRGHANLWPVTAWLDFRCWQDDHMRTIRDMARSRGLLFSINHPKEGGPGWDFGSFFDPDCVEVWCGPWFLANYQALAAWDGMLRERRRVTAVGGSDKHQGPFEGELGWYEVGTPTTWVWAEALSVQHIQRGLRAGRVFISEGPAGPRLELQAEAGGRQVSMGEGLPVPSGAPLRLTGQVWGAQGGLLRLVSAHRVLQVEISDEAFTHTWDVTAEDDLYFRPEVIEPPEAPLDEEPAALMARALGNPIYLYMPG